MFLGSPATLRDRPGVPDLPVPQAFLEILARESLKVPAREWKETFRGLPEDDALGELGGIEVPALIIWGDRDEVLARRDQETLAAGIVGSRLVVYSGAGHALYWEEPERVASDLAAFAEDAGNPRRGRPSPSPEPPQTHPPRTHRRRGAS